MLTKGTIAGLNNLGPNAQFIGQSAARSKLNTPALILDIDILDRNILKMANFVRTADILLRPHAKCHKTVSIAKRQIAAGAIGLCCANIGEAEVMTAGGISDLLITSPLVTSVKIGRLCALAQRNPDIKVVVDNLENVKTLSKAAINADVTLNILVDIDPGMQRTGVSDNTASLAMAQLVEVQLNLIFCGLQCYAGHLQHVGNFSERQRENLKIMEKIAAIRDILTAEGLAPQIISGGGTGTYDIDGSQQVFTELQAGSYIFMDSQYNDVWQKNGITPPFETALFVQTSVISTNKSNAVTTDAGLKHFSMDGGQPVPVKGVAPDVQYDYAGDEFGVVQLSSEEEKLPLAARIECIVPHCDPTVNLYNVIHCFSGETLVDIWPISARGV